jgi:hypothetical protein
MSVTSPARLIPANVAFSVRLRLGVGTLADDIELSAFPSTAPC